MTTEERLERLERRNCWMLLGVVLLILGYFVIATQSGMFTGIIHAKHFVVVDSQGQTRAELVGEGLSLSDRNGKERAVLCLVENGPALALCDGNGEIRAAFGVDEKTGPKLTLSDKNGKTRAGMDVDEKNGPDIGLFDKAGQPCAEMHVTENGPGLGLRDGNGKFRAMVFVNNDGPTLKMLDENEKTILRLPETKLKFDWGDNQQTSPSTTNAGNWYECATRGNK